MGISGNIYNRLLHDIPDSLRNDKWFSREFNKHVEHYNRQLELQAYQQQAEAVSEAARTQLSGEMTANAIAYLVGPNANIDAFNADVEKKISIPGVKEGPKFLFSALSDAYHQLINEKRYGEAKELVHNMQGIKIGTAKITEGKFADDYGRLLSDVNGHDNEDVKNRLNAERLHKEDFLNKVPDHPYFQELVGKTYEEQRAILARVSPQLLRGQGPGIASTSDGVLLRNALEAEVAKSKDESVESQLIQAGNIKDMMETGHMEGAAGALYSMPDSTIKKELIKEYRKFSEQSSPYIHATNTAYNNIQDAIDKLPGNTPEEQQVQTALRERLNKTRSAGINGYIGQPAQDRDSWLYTEGIKPYQEIAQELNKIHTSNSEKAKATLESYQNELDEGRDPTQRYESERISGVLDSKQAPVIKEMIQREKTRRKTLTDLNNPIPHGIIDSVRKFPINAETSGWNLETKKFDNVFVRAGITVEQSSKFDELKDFGKTHMVGEYTADGPAILAQRETEFHNALVAGLQDDTVKEAIKSRDSDNINRAVQAMHLDVGQQYKDHMEKDPGKPFIRKTGSESKPVGGAESKPVGSESKPESKPAKPKSLWGARDTKRDDIWFHWSNDSLDAAGNSGWKQFNDFHIPLANLNYLGERLNLTGPQVFATPQTLQYGGGLARSIAKLLDLSTARELHKTGFFTSNPLLDDYSIGGSKENRDAGGAIQNVRPTWNPAPAQLLVLKAFADKNPFASKYLEKVRENSEDLLNKISTPTSAREKNFTAEIVEANKYIGIPIKAVLTGRYNVAQRQFKIDPKSIPWQVTPLFKDEKELDNYLQDYDKITEVFNALGLPIDGEQNLAESSQYKYFETFQRRAIRRISN